MGDPYLGKLLPQVLSPAEAHTEPGDQRHELTPQHPSILQLEGFPQNT